MHSPHNMQHTTCNTHTTRAAHTTHSADHTQHTQQTTTSPRNGGDLAIQVDSSIQGGNLLFRTGGNNERLRIDSTGAITVGNRSDIHSTRALARFGIDCHGRNVIGNENTVANYGLVFYNDPTSNHANGIGFFNDDGCQLVVDNMF